MMKSHRVTGSGGVQLHVVEDAGNRGVASSRISRPTAFPGAGARSRQMKLGGEEILIDSSQWICNGHGFSDTPREGTDSTLWAQ
jgi:hypothetical protein